MKRKDKIKNLKDARIKNDFLLNRPIVQTIPFEDLLFFFIFSVAAFFV